ncbi:ORC-CDC6 family AAA ATPase [Flavobacterium sp. 3-218]
MKNPFEVNTPEGINAEDVHDLFVDVFSDFHQVPKSGHTFLNGPRGSGKSMMFRYMMPNCQRIIKLDDDTIRYKEFSELDYFSLYVPIKLTDINLKEFEKFKNDASIFINEHLLTSYIASKCFLEFSTLDENLDKYIDEISHFYKDTFLWYLELTGFDISKYENLDFKSAKEYFAQMVKLMDKVFITCKKYWVNLAINPNESGSYNGSLCNYLDFLLPILKEIKKMSFMPQNKPIYLLIDDAGYLNKTQAQVLNTWVSYRTSSDVCLKISTQIDYKSYKTTSDKTIDSPHDYSEVNIADIYLTTNNNYYKRVDEIVKKRISKFLKKNIASEDFFPADKEQLIKLQAIKEDLKEKFKNNDKKHTAGDAARRYATSEYFKQISGNSSTYSYSGFENLVAISSGIIRHFLEPASNMFANYHKDSHSIDFIPDNIQNNEINEYSKRFFEEEFVKINEEHGSKRSGERFSKADKLYNLIQGLGGVFKKIFMSNRTERIVFSVALNNLPDAELSEIIDLAVHYGYLHRSTIGNKQGTGRNKLYILSRTLAPYFKLDPTGIKGYRFMSSEQLKISLTNPKKFIDDVSKSLDNELDNVAPTLFDNIEI